MAKVLIGNFKGPTGVKGDKGDTGTSGTPGATGVRGSQWFSGTGITGTSTTETIFSGSGVTSSMVGDYYLNTSTGNTYRCTLAGEATVAKWVWVGNIKGAPGKDGSTELATVTQNGLMSSSDKSKLDGIETGANKYTHPATHPASIISQDASNRFVTDTEKTTWNNKASSTVATSSANGLMSSSDKNKLDGIEAGANKYTHPATHPASIISQDANNRFVTDTEKTTWNNKANSTVATSLVNGLMSAADKSKLDKLDENNIPNVKSYGAYGDNTSHPISSVYPTLAKAQEIYPFVTSLSQEIDWAAIQKALNENQTIYVPPGKYAINERLILPQGVSRSIKGGDSRSTIFYIVGNTDGAIYYQRDNTNGGSVLTVSEIAFIDPSLSKTKFGIAFFGYGAGKDDNWLRMKNCEFHGLQIGVSMNYCGQCHFNGNYSQNCGTQYRLGRGASFIFFDECVGLSSGCFLYAEDTLADGYSNGIFIDKCTNVWATDIDVCVKGWQAIFITDCGFDLGAAGSHSIYLQSCYDFNIKGSWIASYLTSAPARVDIQCVDCHSFSIVDNSIVNGFIGIKIEGNASYSTKANISGNKFEGNTKNDVLFLYTSACKVTNNTFNSLTPNTGTDYEFYGSTTGTNYNVVANNTFRAASYTITCGANSVVKDNIFGVPA